ncbi:MAG TPA: 16S rRNA (guanine(527)-N(7))-methyltransferase RsmG [Candidatus Stercorousia faecigallinarum]|nr:16S rRNA (guanine(527)-N(7))-methyltransferase RsmG [Candidatus Stercorousia faecigallinarum]
MKNKEFFTDYIKAFLNQNSKLNLISKNDEKFLWEKHIFDSLSIEKFFEKYKPSGSKLLDIGTGGGFPSVPTALAYPDIEVFALDSIRKKINAIENIKAVLNIQNLHTICDRAENIKDKFDIITSRAVAPLKIIIGYAMPLLNKNGYFVAYKSIRTEEEIKEAKNILKKYNAEVTDIIKYDLPLEENHTRNLIIIKKN